MIIHDLTSAQCEELLGRSTIGRLACARNGQPYIVPISYSFDRPANCLYGFATVGQKIVWMRENPKVCVAVDEVADHLHWTSVLVIGRYEELHDEHESRGPWQRVQELFEQRQTWWLPATGKRPAGPEHTTPVFYRIRIDHLSGRRTTRPA